MTIERDIRSFPCRQDRISVPTMTHLLSSKGFHYRHNTVSQSHAAVLRRATQNPRTSYFFSLPTSSVSRLAVAPVPKAKRGLFLASDLNQGDIVAAPWQCSDEPGVEQYFLGEVGSVNRSERKLSVTFLTDNVPSDYSWDDPETGKILRVNDAKAGAFSKRAVLALSAAVCFRSAQIIPSNSISQPLLLASTPRHNNTNSNSTLIKRNLLHPLLLRSLPSPLIYPRLMSA